MQCRTRLPFAPAALIAGALILAGCGGTAVTSHQDGEGRPRAKPAEVTAMLTASGRGGGDVGGLTRARISTKSGEILILEPDGSVTTMSLDSDAGRDAFMVSQADLEALNANLDLDFGGMVAPNLPREKTAQEKALEEFAARAQPALPAAREGVTAQPDDFIAFRIDTLNAGRGDDLIEVTANLRRGVDADIAFAYATCALAGWADENGVAYGRHIRTLQATRNGKLLVGSAFTVSNDRPLGLRVMETKDTLRECEARGIPAA
ncbi:MAG: hypothetical protein ACK41U_02400 [Paracoccus sp. (in: a-proteobacteria)]|uniref:hypothetical protein n=1 Tax=Paracoccus sp. TaxID=267 RepID=UPI00391BDA3C